MVISWQYSQSGLSGLTEVLYESWVFRGRGYAPPRPADKWWTLQKLMAASNTAVRSAVSTAPVYLILTFSQEVSSPPTILCLSNIFVIYL